MTEFAVFSLAFFSGLLFAAWYGRNTKRFIWAEYLAILAFPILALIWLTYSFGIEMLGVYIFSAFAGMCIEFAVGLAYHKALGTRLWQYKRLALRGYTSWLATPLWGFVGIFFFLFVKASGL